LALAQTELVRAAACAAKPGIEIEVRTIKTSGDRVDVAPDLAGLKGLFTKEIQGALLAGEIDVAVHSMKDLPGHLPPETAIGAVLERAPSNDAIIVRNRPWKCVGTSSVRRSRQIQWQFPEVAVEPIRGNVQTRLRKLGESDTLDAVLLAEAGLVRLGLDAAALGFEVEPLDLLPAIGQGIIALETRADDRENLALLSELNHEPTWCCARAERELLRLLNGDCRLPVAMKTVLADGLIRAEAMLFDPEPGPPRRAEASGPAADPEAVAAEIFCKLGGGSSPYAGPSR
jgi:hydroxymethylbilane synthase